MKRFYYEPKNEDALPVEYEFSGSTCVFESPHAYHTKVEEWYDVGVILNERTGTPKLDLKGQPLMQRNRKFKWVPDEQKNALMKAGRIHPPRNWRDMTDAELRHLRQSRFSQVLQQLTSETEVKERQAREIERMRLDHLAEIEKLKAELEAERARVARDVEVEKRRGRVKE